jgi:hypothetical protein
MNMEEISLKLDAIKLILPKGVDSKIKKFNFSVPFKIISIRDALLHRLVNLGEESVMLHGHKSLIPFLLTVRACLETAALIFSLNRYIEAALDGNSLDLLTDQLHRTALGSRNSTTDFDSVNILGAIDKLEKSFPGIREHYDNLSEYCHPNFEGVLCSYSDLTDENEHSYLLQTERVKVGEAPLKIALISGLEAYDYARENYKILVERFYA